MHRRGIAHPDLRYGGNVLVSEIHAPLIVGCQSHVKLGGMPRFLRRTLENADLGGVYKRWSDRHPESLGAEHLAFLGRANNGRRLSALKGYSGLEPQHHKNRPPENS